MTLQKQMYTNTTVRCSYLILFIVAFKFRVIFQTFEIRIGDCIKQLETLSETYTKGFILLCWMLNYVYIAFNTIISVALWYGFWHLMEEVFDYPTDLFVLRQQKWIFYSSILLLVVLGHMKLSATISMVSCPLTLEF